ncbi:Beta-glucosidase 1B [Colletotrichum karsti]|uniref:beta-glucosidase n=1 Tax=Colletotrichum karsti TaxID=1095194 RepID=A0A9P6I9A6_9PEZI|nr:Beta-glucosidase 1B [Colletotrichum karsti]KAF9879222.1 Beta-glucosidase 1B [Colletotrichum karsti]
MYPTLPKDFIWGFGTASYQVEGAVEEDRRGLSTWDVFCEKSGKIADGSSGEFACDTYHRTTEDIALLKSYNVKAYRFSVSWSRVIPSGGRDDPVNEKGLRYYIDLVDQLVAAGIQPVVTLHQWDPPQALHERYGGPLNKHEFVADFARYARLMFTSLGSKVKIWMTITEPLQIAINGYNKGIHAPGRSSDRSVSEEGDSSRECWIVGHSLLLAHATAVKIYREEFQEEDGGEIGITLYGEWGEPWDSDDERDHHARDRFLDFGLPWFADPIYHGHYPQSMRDQLGNRLPSFTPEEVDLVKGSNDFFGLDYYTSAFVKHRDAPPTPEDYSGNVERLQENSKGESIGPETESPWLRSHPDGLRKLLNFISDRYGHCKIYVAENGTSVKGEDDLPLEEALEDDFRCEFYRAHVDALVKARVEDSVDVRMYMAWSFLDNFEWADGYRVRFGVTYVDFKNGRTRYPKKSAKVLRELFAGLLAGGSSND